MKTRKEASEQVGVAEAHEAWVEQNPLRKWRKKAGLTQCAVACAIGRSTQGVRNHEYGSYFPTPESVEAIAKLMEVTAVTLQRRWDRWMKGRPRVGG